MCLRRRPWSGLAHTGKLSFRPLCQEGPYSFKYPQGIVLLPLGRAQCLLLIGKNDKHSLGQDRRHPGWTYQGEIRPPNPEIRELKTLDQGLLHLQSKGEAPGLIIEYAGAVVGEGVYSIRKGIVMN